MRERKKFPKAASELDHFDQLAKVLAVAPLRETAELKIRATAKPFAATRGADVCRDVITAAGASDVEVLRVPAAVLCWQDRKTRIFGL